MSSIGSKNLTMANLIAGAFAPNLAINTKYTLDSIKKGKKADNDDNDDNDDDMQFDTSSHSARMDAMSAVHGWLDSDDLDTGEGEGDRLMGVMMAAVHGDADGNRLTPEQSEHFDMIREEAGRYLLSLGADEDDIHAMLNNWDDDAADNVRHAVSGVEMDSVGFGYYLDAAKAKKPSKYTRANANYSTHAVVRGEQKTYVKKRVSGTVHLSAKQKAALKKGRKKVWTAAMKLKLSKSMKASYKLGLHGLGGQEHNGD